MIGALCTPVTHAIMPVMAEAKVPLVIATSAGQDFVDASGVGGNDYAFKTIPSEVDIARGLMRWLKSQNVKSVAIVAAADNFPQANAIAMAKAAQDAGIRITGQETLDKGTTDFGAVLEKLKAGAPDQVVAILGPYTAGILQGLRGVGLESAGDRPHRFCAGAGCGVAAVPRIRCAFGYDRHCGLHTRSTDTGDSGFRQSLIGRTTDWSRRSGLSSSTKRRSWSRTPSAGQGPTNPPRSQQALKTTTMPSLLGGTYAPDDHNHAHTPLQIFIHTRRPTCGHRDRIAADRTTATQRRCRVLFAQVARYCDFVNIAH